MSDLYKEIMVKRKPKPMDSVKRFLLIGAVVVLAAAERAGRRRREEYHRELIREFSESDESQQ